MRSAVQLAAALALALPLAACGAGSAATCPTDGSATLSLTIAAAKGSHHFCVEQAATEPQQQRGLMFRIDLRPDGGMLFWPYPPQGGGPKEANFWMKDTPTSLDILFLRPDGTIARIADNTVPFSETPIPSGEPVGAVLELVAGRAAALGIAEGNRVTWQGQGQ